MKRYSDIANGDTNVFEALVYEYNQPLNAFVYQMIDDKDAAEDIVQDAFMTVWCNRKKLKAGESIGAYLYTLIRNASLNFLRQTKKFRYDAHSGLPSHEDADLFILQEEFYRLVDSAVNQLPERTEQVIRLSIAGMSQDEIAREMGVTVSNVKNLKSIGNRRLREILGPYFILLF